MTGNVWVYKLDGTLQCGQGKEIPLNEMQKELEQLGATVINAEKRQSCLFFPRACGCPTGSCNAYEISEADWKKISSGFVGTLGFRLWTCDVHLEADDDLPWPWSKDSEVAAPGPWAAATSVTSNPVLVRELIGRPCRCYTQGDALTQDFRPQRVNIEHDKDGRIADIWFG